MVNKIQDFYNEYKVFINRREMPKIVPNFDMSDSILDSLAYIDRDDIRGESIPIYINTNLFKYPKQYYESILFHEFTHIYDANIIFKDEDDETFSSLISSYSEFHASQVEILCNIGYNRAYNINHKFRMSTKLYYKDEIMDVDHYLLPPLADATAVLEHDRYDFIMLPNNEFVEKYVLVQNNIMYYLGKYNVCEKFGDSNPHNFFKEFNVFEADVLKMYDSLKNKKYADIINDVNNFMLHYLQYYVNDCE